MNTERDSQSAHLSNKNRSTQSSRTLTSADILQSMNSSTFITAFNQSEEEIKPSSKQKRPLSRLFSSKTSLQEFRHYPERFLSKSNRYLPLLHHQAMQIKSRELLHKHQAQSSFFDASDLAYDDVNSFLSEDIEIGFVQS
jgi:hypothetical protein